MIPFVDLKAQYHSIKPKIDAAIAGVLESSQFVLGREVTAFEAEFAAYCQTSHAIGVNSGTSALHLALLAAGVGPGDEVITVPFTFVATVAAIRYTGARPVFVDIDPQSYTLDIQQLEPQQGLRLRETGHVARDLHVICICEDIMFAARLDRDSRSRCGAGSAARVRHGLPGGPARWTGPGSDP